MERQAGRVLAEAGTRRSGAAHEPARNIEVEEDGAAKWITNGRYLPADVVEKLIFAGADFFSAEATEAKREAQTAAFLDSYRKNHRKTAEERMEIQAAFGKGTKVMNVITGEIITA